VNTGLTGLRLLTRQEYRATPHDPDTKYIVRDGDTVQEYLGSIPIGESASATLPAGSPVRVIPGAAAGVAVGGIVETEEL